jgi:hypothetical protein
MAISSSDLPWWGWLLCAAAAGIVARIGMVVANDARLDKEKRARQGVATICGFIAFWLAVSTGAIGIASLPHFWSLAVLAGLLGLILVGIISLSSEVSRAKAEIKAIIENLNRP